jgi:cellobiose transport system permease protein
LERGEILSTVKTKARRISYAKYGYFFIAPFFIAYIIFNLVPLLMTFYYSFFEYYTILGFQEVGPNFVGFQNYLEVFKETEFLRFVGNTLLIWIVGFIPQIIVSMILALIFSSYRLRIRGKQFFKTVVYMPNLVMASAFSMLFFLLFSDIGPINQVLLEWGFIDKEIRFLSTVWGTRSIIALMNFLMWFGNTTILLMAGVMGVDQTLFEAAEIDGANSWQVFWRITMPSIFPIFIYVLVTSLIGGLQMFDVPQILTDAGGGPNRTSMTVVMFLNRYLTNYNYGISGAISVILFIITAILSFSVFKVLVRPEMKGVRNIAK